MSEDDEFCAAAPMSKHVWKNTEGAAPFRTFDGVNRDLIKRCVFCEEERDRDSSND